MYKQAAPRPIILKLQEIKEKENSPERNQRGRKKTTKTNTLLIEEQR